ncbi:MAG: hypothetical protein ACK56I_19770, partial [bacterium]
MSARAGHELFVEETFCQQDITADRRKAANDIADMCPQFLLVLRGAGIVEQDRAVDLDPEALGTLDQSLQLLGVLRAYQIV